MENRGQITLETAVLLLLAINIFLYITMPAASVSRGASESVGVAAFASKAVDDIVGKANMVGISGEGARSTAEVAVDRDFENLECIAPRNLALRFHVLEVTNVGASSDFGLTAILPPAPTSRSYNRTADFDLSCDFTGITYGRYAKACLCFNNTNGNTIKITGFDKSISDCDCTAAWSGLICGQLGYLGGECNPPDRSCPGSQNCDNFCTCHPQSQSYCGDNNTDVPFNDAGTGGLTGLGDEECDGTDNAACGGQPCNLNCTCPGGTGSGVCGDSLREGSEICDTDGTSRVPNGGTEGICPVGQLCNMSGSTPGVDKCVCNPSPAQVCGDGLKTGTEICDTDGTSRVPNGGTEGICPVGQLCNMSGSTPGVDKCVCSMSGTLVCPCSTCAECTAALANPVCDIVKLTANIDCSSTTPEPSCPG